MIKTKQRQDETSTRRKIDERRGKKLRLEIETQPECETILVGYLVGVILVKLKILWRLYEKIV